MNPEKEAKRLSMGATNVAKAYDLDAAGILTMKGKQICLFMASYDKGDLKNEDVAKAFKDLGNHLLQVSKDIEGGKLAPLTIVKDGETTIQEFKPDKGGEQSKWSAN